MIPLKGSRISLLIKPHYLYQQIAASHKSLFFYNYIALLIMLFTTLSFVVFFSLFFLSYWLLFNKSANIQTAWLLIGSCYFYAWWDWRFLLLLVTMSTLTFLIAIGIARWERYKTALFYACLIVILGNLCFFKYSHFIFEIFNDIGLFPHVNRSMSGVNVILPLGISFYTFRLLSYLLDVQRGKVLPTKKLADFTLYATFFPCVISGPIDRATDFLPQIAEKKAFNYDQASDGMRQILWGLFKKVVIADNCVIMTQGIFEHYQTMPASALWFAAVIYSFEMYADFSGYSDIAIGISNLLGFRVTRNFAYPFFAENIAEYWRRWHISLTSWLTDYVFTPLSIYFRDLARFGLVIAITVNFVLIGLWHGANWTFVAFGVLHSCYFIPLILTNRLNKKRKKGMTGFSMRRLGNRLGTFGLATLAFILFRANSLSEAFDYINHLFSKSVFSHFRLASEFTSFAALLCIVMMMIVEWLQRERAHGLQIDFIKSFGLRVIIYFSLIFIILCFRASATQDFIYFKF